MESWREGLKLSLARFHKWDWLGGGASLGHVPITICGSATEGFDVATPPIATYGIVGEWLHLSHTPFHKWDWLRGGASHSHAPITIYGWISRGRSLILATPF